MASTTLITFMLQAPTTVYSVEILGSWDNFSKPYQLKRDRKTGPGQWRGCHTFENITCDGDTLDASTSRDGGLKMGGTYWYYYVLNGDVEYHDPAEPSTSLCPLLPGQMVNVLDVPVQGEMLLGERRNISSSSLDSAVFTLNPKDKYLPPGVRRATTTSAVHARKARLPTTTRSIVRASRNGSTGAEGAPETSKKIKTVLTLERQRSLLSVFHRMRQTRSAPSNTKSSLVRPRQIFSRTGQSTKQDELPNQSPSLPTTRAGAGFESPSIAGGADRALTALMVNLTGPKHNVHPLEQLTSSDYSQSAHPNEREQRPSDEPATSSVRKSESSFLSSYIPLEQLGDNPSNFATPLCDHLDRLNLAPIAGGKYTDPTKTPLEKQTTISNAVPSIEMPGLLELDFRSPKYEYAESLASYDTSANFSPCLAPNTTHSGPTSPCHLSPETPVTSDTGDYFLPPIRDSESLTQMGRRTSGDLEHLSVNPPCRPARPMSKSQGGNGQSSHATPLGGFQGYSTHDHAHASAITVRKLPSISSKKTDCAPPFTPQSSKQDLVHSWNDGSEHHVTALEELVDDLGYLGEVII